MNNNLIILSKTLSNYDKNSAEYKAYLLGHKEANEFLIEYINTKEDKQQYSELLYRAEQLLKEINTLLQEKTTIL